MEFNEILNECVARKKLAPTKTAVEIVASVMDDIGDIKAALRARPEFAERPVMLVAKES